MTVLEWIVLPYNLVFDSKFVRFKWLYKEDVEHHHK